MYEQSVFSSSAMLVAFTGITMCNAQTDNPHCLIYHMIELVERCVNSGVAVSLQEGFNYTVLYMISYYVSSASRHKTYRNFSKEKQMLRGCLSLKEIVHQSQEPL